MENLNEKQQIEEMARVLRPLTLCSNCLSSLNRDKKRDGGCYKPIGYECSLDRDILKYCESLYNAGYRKQSDGEWVEKAKCGVSIKGYMVCSVCDVMIPACDADGDYYCLSRLDYCPRCGAKMKGESDEKDI